MFFSSFLLLAKCEWCGARFPMQNNRKVLVNDSGGPVNLAGICDSAGNFLRAP